MTSPLETGIQIVVDLLIRGEYGTIEALTRGRRLSSDALEQAVRAYGRSLVDPPPNWLQKLDVVGVDSASSPTYSVVVPLWTKEEGLSDLSLELTMVEFAPGLFETIVDDLRVR